MPKVVLDYSGFEDYLDKLDKLGGSDAVKRGVENGLKESKNLINSKITKSMKASNLPAGGKYSSAPHTIDTLDKDMSVKWSGATGEIHIGFDLKKSSGMVSIYLMYGTPRMDPAKGLKASIYGANTKKKVQQVQMDTINDVIKKYMEG